MNKEEITEKLLRSVIPKCYIYGCDNFATSYVVDHESNFGDHHRCDKHRSESEYQIGYDDNYVAINETLSSLKVDEHRGRKDYEFADLVRQYINNNNVIDYKGGKELYYGNLDLIDKSKPLSSQTLGQDILSLKYKDCIVDVDMYSDEALTIMVILINNDGQDWSNPYIVIRCFDIDDFYFQLQRVIDLYPNKISELKESGKL